MMIDTRMSRTSNSTAVVQLAGDYGISGHVYAIGRIKPFFPALDVEKEYKQLIPKPLPPELNGAQEDRLLQWVLRHNPFLAHAMGWAFLIGNVSTYLLQPATTLVLEAFVTSIVPESATEEQYNVVLGAQDPAASLEAGREGPLPGVTVNRTFGFTLSDLVRSVELSLRQQGVSPMPTPAQITTLFDNLLQLANNTGDAAEHRALNYVSVNYPEIYVPQSSGGSQPYFSGVETRPSPLGGARSIIDVILKYTSPTNGLVSKSYTTVDVTGQFPFLVLPLQPYFER